MGELIGAILLIGWVGFWVWLRFTNPEACRNACNAMQRAVDGAASSAADAIHRRIAAKKGPPPNGERDLT